MRARRLRRQNGAARDQILALLRFAREVRKLSADERLRTRVHGGIYAARILAQLRIGARKAGKHIVPARRVDSAQHGGDVAHPQRDIGGDRVCAFDRPFRLAAAAFDDANDVRLRVRIAALHRAGQRVFTENIIARHAGAERSARGAPAHMQKMRRIPRRIGKCFAQRDSQRVGQALQLRHGQVMRIIEFRRHAFDFRKILICAAAGYDLPRQRQHPRNAALRGQARAAPDGLRAIVHPKRVGTQVGQRVRSIAALRQPAQRHSAFQPQSQSDRYRNCHILPPKCPMKCTLAVCAVLHIFIRKGINKSRTEMISHSRPASDQ